MNSKHTMNLWEDTLSKISYSNYRAITESIDNRQMVKSISQINLNTPETGSPRGMQRVSKSANTSPKNSSPKNSSPKNSNSPKSRKASTPCSPRTKKLSNFRRSAPNLLNLFRRGSEGNAIQEVIPSKILLVVDEQDNDW